MAKPTLSPRHLCLRRLFYVPCWGMGGGSQENVRTTCWKEGEYRTTTEDAQTEDQVRFKTVEMLHLGFKWERTLSMPSRSSRNRHFQRNSFYSVFAVHWMKVHLVWFFSFIWEDNFDFVQILQIYSKATSVLNLPQQLFQDICILQNTKSKLSSSINEMKRIKRGTIDPRYNLKSQYWMTTWHEQ